MGENIARLNKDRSTKYSKDEIDCLMDLISKHNAVICKKTDHTSVLQKEEAWIRLTDEYNEGVSIFRSRKQLQTKFNKIKKVARQEMAQGKRERRQTGGGPPPPEPSATSEWLNGVMGESISGLPSIYDSDIVHDKSDELCKGSDMLNVPSCHIDFDIREDKTCLSDEVLSEISATPQSSQIPASKILGQRNKSALDPQLVKAVSYPPLELISESFSLTQSPVEYAHVRFEVKKNNKLPEQK